MNRKLHLGMLDREDGFTLIELLVVIIIIGILAAIAIPVYLNQRQKAGNATAQADLHNAITVIHGYATNDPQAIGAYPATGYTPTYTGPEFPLSGVTGSVALKDGSTLTLSNGTKLSEGINNIGGSYPAGICVKVSNSIGKTTYWYDSVLGTTSTGNAPGGGGACNATFIGRLGAADVYP